MSKEIRLPAGYAPAFALGMADSNGQFSVVDESRPLPVVMKKAPTSGGTLLEGETQATVEIGPFQPTLDSPIIVALTGTWTGQVRLTRSTDSGITRLPLTVGGNPWAVYGGNVCEQAWVETENGATYFLDVIVSSGTVKYRVSQ